MGHDMSQKRRSLLGSGSVNTFLLASAHTIYELFYLVSSVRSVSHPYSLCSDRRVDTHVLLL
jgi:hypothetical protein